MLGLSFQLAMVLVMARGVSAAAGMLEMVADHLLSVS